jgi:hypothetical protein
MMHARHHSLANGCHEFVCFPEKETKSLAGDAGFV